MPDNQGIVVQFPAMASDFSLLQNASDCLWSIMMTTELHLVLRSRERVELYYFFPTHAGTTFTVPFVSQLFGAGVFLAFIEPKSLLPC